MGVVAVAVTTPYSIIHAYILHMVFKTFYFVKKIYINILEVDTNSLGKSKIAFIIFDVKFKWINTYNI